MWQVETPREMWGGEVAYCVAGSLRVKWIGKKESEGK